MIDVAGLERTRDVRRRELDVLDARLAETRRTLRDAEAQWCGAQSSPLPLGPLVACVTAITSANAALFCAWALILSACHEPSWCLGFALTAPLALVSLAMTGGHGAGGRARKVLRSVSATVLLASLAGAAWAVHVMDRDWRFPASW
ncbi:MAG: hypothetical protein U0270_37000 [Labilithrix sp.]